MRRRLGNLARSGSTAEYTRARAVLMVLWRYERACRLAGRPVAVMLEGSDGSRAEGKGERGIEREIALIADMERLLRALTRFQRAVVALVGMRRLSETIAAKRLHCDRVAVGKAYWNSVEALYWLLVGAKYLRGESDEEEAEEAGDEPSVAQVEPRVVAGREARAGAIV